MNYEKATLGCVATPADYRNAAAAGINATEREVQGALQRAAGAAEYNRELIAELAARLASVLRPPSPQKETCEGNPPRSTALGAQLSELGSRVADTNCSLRELLDRLEL